VNLVTQPNLARLDEIYARLLAAHEELPLEESAALNAWLVLILANHIGDETVLEQALGLARKAGTSEATA